MRKRRGVKIRLFHRMNDCGQWAWKSSVLRGAHRKRKVMGGSRRADIKVDTEALERLIEPEDEEVCLKYILKYSTRGSTNIFQLFDTSEKEDLRGKQKALVGAPRREFVPMQERWQNEWRGIEWQRPVAKAPVP